VTPAERVLVVDGDCPMCMGFAGVLIRLRLIAPEARRPLQTLEPELAERAVEAGVRNEIVVLEVPASEDRRFDWCRRIKDLSDSTPVVLLLRHPSRQRVTQAFLSRADAILGFPCEEPQLSQKLDTLVPPQASPPDSADDE